MTIASISHAFSDMHYCKENHLQSNVTNFMASIPFINNLKRKVSPLRQNKRLTELRQLNGLTYDSVVIICNSLWRRFEKVSLLNRTILKAFFLQLNSTALDTTNLHLFLKQL